MRQDERMKSDCSTHQLMGWAMDGFGIYAYQDVGGTAPVVDECGGHFGPTDTGEVAYHYHSRTIVPYHLACQGSANCCLVKPATNILVALFTGPLTQPLRRNSAGDQLLPPWLRLGRVRAARNDPGQAARVPCKVGRRVAGPLHCQRLLKMLWLYEAYLLL